jgi:hypothetical protein
MGRLNKGQLRELRELKDSISELEENNIEELNGDAMDHILNSRVVLNEYNNNIKHFDHLKATRRIMGYDEYDPFMDNDEGILLY